MLTRYMLIIRNDFKHIINVFSQHVDENLKWKT